MSGVEIFSSAHALYSMTGAPALVTTTNGAHALITTTDGAHALMIGDGPVKPARDIGGSIKGVGILEKVVLVPIYRHPDWSIPCLRRHMKRFACVAPYRYSLVQYPVRD